VTRWENLAGLCIFSIGNFSWKGLKTAPLRSKEVTNELGRMGVATNVQTGSEEKWGGPPPNGQSHGSPKTSPSEWKDILK